MLKRIRGGSGLGDSIYLQSLVRHLAKTTNHQIEACSNYPDVFSQLPPSVSVVPFNKHAQGLIHAVYSMRKSVNTTDQFQDMCIQAGIQGQVDLKLDWKIRNQELVDSIRLKAREQRIVFAGMIRSPMARDGIDNFGAELLPLFRAVDEMVDRFRDCFIVECGSGKRLHDIKPDLDLTNRTSISDLLDVASICDEFCGQCSFVIPLAESFDKPYTIVFARAGFESRTEFIRRITPEKVFHKKHLGTALFDG